MIDVCFYGKSPALQVENNVNKPCISVDRKDNAKCFAKLVVE